MNARWDASAGWTRTSLGNIPEGQPAKVDPRPSFSKRLFASFNKMSSGSFSSSSTSWSSSSSSSSSKGKKGAARKKKKKKLQQLATDQNAKARQDDENAVPGFVTSTPSPPKKGDANKKQFPATADVIRRRSRISEQPFEPADWVVVKSIGHGAFGHVVVTRERKTKLLCAIKVLDKTALMEMGLVEHARLEREVQRKVKHPFLVSLRFSFQCEFKVYFGMKWYSGGALDEFVRENYEAGHCDVAATKFYAAELLLALGHLHSRSIIHRDVKPENVLVDEEGHVALSDFGFAEFRGRGKQRLVGTLEYMGPELLTKRHEKESKGAPSDCWALGVLLFEISTNERPFGKRLEATPRQLFENVLRSEPDWPTLHQAHVEEATEDLREALQALLLKDPEARSTAEATRRLGFFRDLDWETALARQLDPPRLPRLPAFVERTDQGVVVERDASLSSCSLETTPEMPRYPLDAKKRKSKRYDSELALAFSHFAWVAPSDNNTTNKEAAPAVAAH